MMQNTMQHPMLDQYIEKIHEADIREDEKDVLIEEISKFTKYDAMGAYVAFMVDLYESFDEIGHYRERQRFCETYWDSFDNEDEAINAIILNNDCGFFEAYEILDDLHVLVDPVSCGKLHIFSTI